MLLLQGAPTQATYHALVLLHTAALATPELMEG